MVTHDLVIFRESLLQLGVKRVVDLAVRENVSTNSRHSIARCVCCCGKYRIRFIFEMGHCNRIASVIWRHESREDRGTILVVYLSGIELFLDFAQLIVAVLDLLSQPDSHASARSIEIVTHALHVNDL